MLFVALEKTRAVSKCRDSSSFDDASAAKEVDVEGRGECRAPGEYDAPSRGEYGALGRGESWRCT